MYFATPERAEELLKHPELIRKDNREPKADTTDRSSSASSKRDSAASSDGSRGKPVEIADAVEMRCSACGGRLRVNATERFKRPLPQADGTVWLGRKRYRCTGKCGRFSVGRWIQQSDTVKK
jgi:hypothetical protein